MAEQNSYDFWTRYSNLCLKCKVCPLRSVIKHMKGTTLTCLVERIRCEHWQFLLSALSVDHSLSEVCFKSNLPSLDKQEEMWKKRRRKDEFYPIPYGYSPRNVSDICKYSTYLLAGSHVLQKFVIDNLPVTLEDAKHLAEVLKKSNIREFGFRYYPYSTDVIATICKGLWDSQVAIIDFTACNLNINGLNCVCSIIMKHKERRAVESFPGTLRYRTPDFQEMKGLTRITLNGNSIGDKGVSLICNALSGDHWIQALDMQSCDITNEGAMTLLKEVTVNTLLHVVDIRLNNIDKGIMDKLYYQLDKNIVGKNFRPNELWKRRSVSKIVPKNKQKSKGFKKYSKISSAKKEFRSSLQHALRISYEVVNGPFTKDASVQTDTDSQIAYFQEKLQMLEYMIMKEKSVRQASKGINHRLKEENAYLRQELIKLSSFQDVILIDHETYAQITHVFEKFHKFLQLMKENGLWELATTIGVAEYDNTKLDAIPSTSKTQVPLDLSVANSPVKGQSLLKSPVRCCTCRKPDCISNQKFEHLTKLNKSHNINQNKSAAKNVDKTKVNKVFQNLKKTYTNDVFPPPSQGTHLDDKSLNAELPVMKCHSRRCRGMCVCMTSVPKSFRDVRTRHELFEVVKQRLEAEICTCCCSGYAQKSSVENSNLLKNATSQTVTKNLHVDSHQFNPESLCGESVESFVSEAHPSEHLLQAVNLVKGEDVNEYLSDHLEAMVVNEMLENNPDEYVYYYSGGEITLTEEQAKQFSSSSNYTFSNQELTFDPTKDSFILHNSDKSVEDISTKKGATQDKSNSKSTQSSTKDGSNKSYLESVSDASTDKDVKSFSEIEVFDSDIKSDNSTLKGSIKEPLKVTSASGNASKSLNVATNTSSKSSKTSKKNKKRNAKKLSSKNDNLSSSSVPSLSDITTVSSRSLNTDSVMGQLSENDKGYT